MKVVEILERVLTQSNQVIAHGDFKAMAELFRSIGYGNWNGDYIRKVLRGTKNNTAIILGACAFYEERAKMHERLRKRLQSN